MRVIKEAWLLAIPEVGGYMQMQNTTTPKLYVSEESAKLAATYYANAHNNGAVIHTPIKTFLVVEDDIPF